MEALKMPRIVVLAIVLVGGVAAMALWSRSSDGRAAKESYLLECRARPDGEDCPQRADQHHDACFVATYHARTRSSEKHFDRVGYAECVDRGHAAWLELKRERARERQQRKDLYAE